MKKFNSFLIAALFISLFLQNPIVSSDCGGQGRDCAPTEYSSSMGVTEVKCAPTPETLS